MVGMGICSHKRDMQRVGGIYETPLFFFILCACSYGIADFIKCQYTKYACSKCGSLISIHNKKCFQCDTITKLVDKNA